MFDSANSLFQTGHQRKGTLFQRYQQISVVTSIMVSIRAGRVKQQKSKVLALVNASLLEVLAGLLNSCMLLLLQPDPATYWLEESEAAEIKGACPRECFLAGGAATVPLM